ncbi:STAS domain-containing protein [Mycolicibacterium parafortuitum]|uniref:Anti-anti-sigma factor [Saccharomonospora viridis DSM] n=1 Tax=Mycolicibacterium parafortuitum TaxID=39692 RepID=A0A375YKV1_MYCPF|nr:STAS domain-containing protein [Mycolicibacterium parafortuitum]ORB26664.1 anti-anti-sigma factor [Mycolicibacterium parafortuitum]SRX81604.1 anti-anti-sigma factor [Saccharomonospora viridis DSM] [Mycolicibacterium parafortuitum]
MVAIKTERIFSSPISADHDEMRCGAAVFSARPCSDHRLAVAVLGEVDAVNGRDFARYVERHARISRQLVLDLRAVDFFGSQGFTALFYISVHCARSDVDWAIVASPPVRRLLAICDPQSELPLADDLASALERLDRLAHRRAPLVWSGRSGWRTG